jgi:uncharacterized protein
MAESSSEWPQLPDGLLLEGIVTTLDQDGSPHIAPMGPIIDMEFTRLLLRPYRTSQTYQNLKRNGTGVLHVTDDVELIARAAVGELAEKPAMFLAEHGSGPVLADCCRWYAFQVASLDDSQERTEIRARVVERGHIREFFGFNRAKHAIIEAAILATRIAWLDPSHVRTEMKRLAGAVEKTGGRQEHAAFAFLERYFADHLAAAAETASR